jgi:hypothetical protein
MTLTIIQKGSSYLCFRNVKSQDQLSEFVCNQTSGWKGWKWSWTPEKAEIKDSTGEVVCSINYKLRIFRPSKLNIILKYNQMTSEIRCEFPRNFRDTIIRFNYENDEYEFHTYKNNYRILNRNHIQVASFNKEWAHLFNRDVFKVMAEDDLSIPLLFCFAIYDDLAKEIDSSTVSFDFGNIIGTKPPDGEKWRPKTTPNSAQSRQADKGSSS